jgi:hypothetical protein
MDMSAPVVHVGVQDVDVNRYAPAVETVSRRPVPVVGYDRRIAGLVAAAMIGGIDGQEMNGPAGGGIPSTFEPIWALGAATVRPDHMRTDRRSCRVTRQVRTQQEARVMRIRILIARTLTAVLMTTTFACAAPPVHDVTITARDYAFSIPASVPAGLTAFHFVNRGKVPHEVQFFRFNPGVSATTARGYLATGTVPDSVADPSGSVLIATPGDSVREALLV